jgi:hypothetical protein
MRPVYNTNPPQLYQAGTYAPSNSNLPSSNPCGSSSTSSPCYRWMGNAAVDYAGNIAVGYSFSNSETVSRSIGIAARCAGGSPGPADLGTETAVWVGNGSQGDNLDRWGDYSSMSVDPVDGSLWFTTEYLPNDGSFNWHTKIANFTISGCSSP